MRDEHSRLVVCEYCGSHLEVTGGEAAVLGQGDELKICIYFDDTNGNSLPESYVKIADIKIDLEAGRLLGYRASAMHDGGERAGNGDDG